MTASLTIGELAQRTGVSATTLRMWEQRHGFPIPQRLPSGHRRYLESDVELVTQVVEHQEAGVRLDVAISRSIDAALRRAEPAAPSVYAELRRRHPGLAPQRLRKSTLLALSWAIEDEIGATAERAHLFGAFQQDRFFAQADERWGELARVAASAFVFADFDEEPGTGRPVRVPLPDDAPLRREWAVVCDAARLPVALTAWELPGQAAVPDRDRMFECVWTLDPVAVRDAARVCAGVAYDAGATQAGPVVRALAEAPQPGRDDLASVTAMFNRVVAYVDRFGSHTP